MRKAVLVNGVPASGKRTVASAIAAHFGWPLVALDTIKEPFFTYVGTGDRDYNRKLGKASYAAMFDLIAGFPAGSTTVLEAWFGFQPLEVLQEHLRRADVGAVAEIWCQADPQIVTKRYAARIEQRSPGHPGADYLPELTALAAREQPFGLGPLHRVETTLPVEVVPLVAWLLKALGVLAVERP